jgi:signal transduction histidine kinase
VTHTQSEIRGSKFALPWGGLRARLIVWFFVPAVVVLAVVAVVFLYAYPSATGDSVVDRRSLPLLLGLGVVLSALAIAVGVRRVTRLVEQRVANRTRELAALNAIAATVGQSPNLDESLDDALGKVLQVMDIEAGGVYLLDEESGLLTIATQRGFSPQFVSEIDRLKVGEGFSGRVVESGQPLVVRNVSTDPRLTRAAVQEEGLRSVAIVPLSSRRRVLGTLFAATRGYREFTEQEVQSLSSIGHQIGVAIENARLLESEQRRAEQFRVIGEVGRHIASILDVDELLGEIVRLLKETFGYYMITIGLIEGNEVVFKAGVKTHWAEPQFRPPPLKVGDQGITSWVAATGESLLVPDVSKEPRYRFLADAAETRSELAVPLKTKSGIIGVLNVESDQLNAFDESDVVVLQSLAHQAAVAIENARLYEQAQQLAVVEERQRLARELHDAVTQTLFSASLIAEVVPRVWAIDPDEGGRQLEEVRLLTRGALAEMRTLLLELRPEVLIEAEMNDLLQQLGSALTGRTGVPVVVIAEGEWELPAPVQIALYRIAQEALNNAGKHAGASQVDVYFTSEPDRVVLAISDDGRGFDVASIPPGHLGLGIMRERAAAIGARLEIDSEIGRGTGVVVVWEEDE